MGKFDYRIGETRTMSTGLKATVIAYRNTNNVDLQFENGIIAKDRSYDAFKRGSIKCPMMVEHIEDYVKVTNANLSPPFSFLCDIEDLRIARKVFWSADSEGYVTNGKFGQFHRLIINAPAEIEVDHKNRNKIDCRKRNLRACTHAENLRNRGALSNNTSGYKGVSLVKASKKYKAGINKYGKHIYLGSYDTPEAAAQAYNEAAIKHHGEFACLNTI